MWKSTWLSSHTPPHWDPSKIHTDAHALWPVHLWKINNSPGSKLPNLSLVKRIAWHYSPNHPRLFATTMRPPLLDASERRRGLSPWKRLSFLLSAHGRNNLFLLFYVWKMSENTHDTYEVDIVASCLSTFRDFAWLEAIRVGISLPVRFRLHAFFVLVSLSFLSSRNNWKLKLLLKLFHLALTDLISSMITLAG